MQLVQSNLRRTELGQCRYVELAGVTLDGSLATQYSTALGGPEQAVDGNPSTSSCTHDTAGQPWWSIDLADVYSIATVAITFPATGADTRKYHYTALCLNGSRQR